jgi:hypothetical protein
METSTIVSYTQARNASIDEEPQTSAENARVCATTLNEPGSASIPALCGSEHSDASKRIHD